MIRLLISIFLLTACSTMIAQDSERDENKSTTKINDIKIIRQCLISHILVESPLVNDLSGLPDKEITNVTVGRLQKVPYAKVGFSQERERIIDGKIAVMADGKSFDCWFNTETNEIISIYYSIGGGSIFEKIITPIDMSDEEYDQLVKDIIVNKYAIRQISDAIKITDKGPESE